MSKHIVLSAKPYDFQSNGSRISGLKISYINTKPTSRKGEEGYPPLIVNISNNELIEKIERVPALYEMDFEQVTGKNNRPEIVLSDIDYISDIDFSILHQNM